MKRKLFHKSSYKEPRLNNKSRKPLRIGKIVFGIFTLLLLASVLMLGLTVQKQSSLLSKQEKRQKEAQEENDLAITALKDDMTALTNENETLKMNLANCSGYLSEDDFITPDSIQANASENDTPDDNSPETDNENKDSEEAASDKDKEKDKDNEKSYQEKYKNLYVREKDSKPKRVVHLTFDDGPSQNTPKVLDILDRFDVKATFFVVFNDEAPYCDYYKEIVERGHTLAIHTATHNYKKIYASVDAYLEDFDKIYSYVYEKTGVRPTLFRYPGGSTNCFSYSAGPAIMKEMERRGFIYYDWNVSSGDGGNQATRSTIFDWVTKNASRLEESVVLMHDSQGKAETVAALPSIIETLQKEGCTFEPLSTSTEPVQFKSK